VPEVKIAAETRDEFGKGAARRTRREGRVPAVLYGHGTETRHLTLPGHDLMRALLKNIIEHVDLILVRSGEKVTIDVPIRLIGEIFPGGVLNQQIIQIPVEAEATHIPQGIDVDVEGMEMGQAIYASDLKLPAGVTLQIEPDTLVLHVMAQQTAEEAGEETAEAASEVPAALDDAAGSEGE